jgi:MYXO-CTERM domain-containing protein
MRAAAVLRCTLVVFCLSAVAGIEACGPAPGEPVGETSEALGFANDQAAFDYFLSKGLANYQAAGIVGNLDQESGVDPTAVQAGGPGRGIAQWSVGGRWDTDANDNAVWYATQQGQSVDSLQLQLDFVWYELTTFPDYGLAALKASTNVTDATVAFQNDFEGCGTCDQSQRVTYAENVLSEYGNDPVDGGVDAGSGDTPCTVPGAGAGECMPTTDCAALPGHTSTPGYCPGAADIQCCTGPADAGPDSGGKNDAGSGASSGGSSSGAASSSGASSIGSSGASPEGGTGSSSGANESPAGEHGSGCSVSPGPTRGSMGGAALLGALALLVTSRRRRRAGRTEAAARGA